MICDLSLWNATSHSFGRSYLHSSVLPMSNRILHFLIRAFSFLESSLSMLSSNLLHSSSRSPMCIRLRDMLLIIGIWSLVILPYCSADNSFGSPNSKPHIANIWISIDSWNNFYLCFPSASIFFEAIHSIRFSKSKSFNYSAASPLNCFIFC